MAVSLEARLTVRPGEARRREEFIAEGALVNVGDEGLVLNLAPLGAPSLALEIVDSAGSPVHLPPPPVPGAEVPRAEIMPGRSYTMKYPGFVPQWTPPGIYRARLRYTYRPASPAPREWTGLVVSEWVEFSILD